MSALPETATINYEITVYEGNVTKWDEKDGMHYIEYQDGESHWQDLAGHAWQLLMVSVEDTYRRK